MYQLEVFHPVASFWVHVMLLDFFIIEEILATPWAHMVLIPSDLSFLGRQTSAFRLEPVRPVLLQVGVIWGRCSLDHNVPSDGEPGKLQEVVSCLFIAKYPVVIPLGVQLSPVPLYAPL